jgi:phospholipid transport system substrate-binding protein
MIRWLFLFSTLLCLVAPLRAESATGSKQQAGAFITQLGDEAIAILGGTDLKLEEREARFRHLLGQSFDLAFIGRFVLGRYWPDASPEQRADYHSLFTAYVLRIYSSRLGGYAGETFAVLGVKQAGEKDVLVSTRIHRPSGSPLLADWRVRVIDGRHRIIDVMVAGISMVITQRSEFASVIQKHGFVGLLEALRARTERLVATASVQAGARP